MFENIDWSKRTNNFIKIDLGLISDYYFASLNVVSVLSKFYRTSGIS